MKLQHVRGYALVSGSGDSFILCPIITKEVLRCHSKYDYEGDPFATCAQLSAHLKAVFIMILIG